MSPARMMKVMQVLLWCLLAVVLLRTAWVCDDAYITMRCVDNALHGHGFTFNPIERVQAYTHPLWALLIMPFHAIFRNAYWEMLVLGIGFAMAAMRIVGRSLQDKWAWLALPLIAISSKAFIEYSTSGLENALSYFLLALFVREWWRSQSDRGSLFKLSLLTSLILLNRMDLLLIVGPALAVVFWRERSWHALRLVLLGFLPFLLWEVFAVIYYGFPFPNTAYAKLGTLISPAKLMQMGKGYFGDSLRRDAVTLPFIGLGIAAGLRYRRQWPLALGTLLYLVYVLRIGGDFMSGRFFAVPFLVAMMIIARALEGQGWRWTLLAGSMSVAALFAPTPVLVSGSDFGIAEENLIGPSGVADERAFYYSGTGMLHALEGREMPDHPWAVEGMEMKKLGRREMRIRKVIGMTGYFAGPLMHFVDPFALSDPLLARIPAVYRPHPRAGHYHRRIPLGHAESVMSPRSQITDPVIKAMDAELRLITRGPLFSRKRWAAIWTANTHSVDVEALHPYWIPLDHQIDVQRKTPIKIGTSQGNSTWFRLPSGAKSIRFQVTTEAYCDLVWLQGGTPIGGEPIDGLTAYDLQIPVTADAVAFLREGHGFYCELADLEVN